jgi:hypothetical protein
MQWPDHFPDGCPPETAQPASVKVYRFVNNDPPNTEDFRSWRQENMDQPCPKGITECQACGISVFTSEEGVCKARNKVPALRNKQAALGNLTPGLGVILNTPSRKTGHDHHTWWIPTDREPWSVFQVVNVTCPDTQ